MYQSIRAKLSELHAKQAPATGLGLFRVLYGLVTLQEVLFLLYFNHLIFDPIPYLDVEFPTLSFFLCLWVIIACCVVIGYRYSFTMLANYIFWMVFVNFTTMQRDFDGGFDIFMIGAGFFLLFLPADRALSIDNLRYKLSTPFTPYQSYTTPTVSRLAYLLPVAICLGFLYFDSSIHKMFAQHWRNGLGSWLPSTQPYYVSALDMSWLLNQEWLEKTIGYTIIVFQFTFIFNFFRKKLRVVYLFIGLGLHLGITFSLNIYPFGMGMTVFYCLMIPFSWWRWLNETFTAKTPALTVFFDQQCPLCNRTALTLNHFDIFKRIEFKPAQQYAKDCPALVNISETELLKDLYAVDTQGKVYSGLATYIQIALKMGYTAPIGWILSLPIINSLAANKYRSIADNRVRCDASCVIVQPLKNNTLYEKIFVEFAARKPKAFNRKLTNVLLLILLLQLNSSIHYGLFYRLDLDIEKTPLNVPFTQASNSLIMLSQLFLGITPHALYVHDHFMGYDRILAITYTGKDGVEHWLPFVNEQGRLLAPNWGRVHSMWANIAVTTTIDNQRIRKFIMKVTAFYGHDLGLDLNQTTFHIKMKKIDAPTEWVYDQLHKNFAGEWKNVGVATWSNSVISFDLPENLNSL